MYLALSTVTYCGTLDRRLLFSPANYKTEVIETKQMLLVEKNLIPSEQLSYLVAGDLIWLLLCSNSSCWILVLESDGSVLPTPLAVVWVFRLTFSPPPSPSSPSPSFSPSHLQIVVSLRYRKHRGGRGFLAVYAILFFFFHFLHFFYPPSFFTNHGVNIYYHTNLCSNPTIFYFYHKFYHIFLPLILSQTTTTGH